MGRSEELGVGTLVVIENKKKKLYVKRATGLGASKTQWEKKLPALATEANSTKRRAKRCEPVCFQLVSQGLPVGLWWICKKGGRSDVSAGRRDKEGEGLSVLGKCYPPSSSSSSCSMLGSSSFSMRGAVEIGRASCRERVYLAG